MHGDGHAQGPGRRKVAGSSTAFTCVHCDLMHWDDSNLVVLAVTEGPGLVYLLADGLVTALSSAEQLWHVTA